MCWIEIDGKHLPTNRPYTLEVVARRLPHLMKPRQRHKDPDIDVAKVAADATDVDKSDRRHATMFRVTSKIDLTVVGFSVVTKKGKKRKKDVSHVDFVCRHSDSPSI